MNNKVRIQLITSPMNETSAIQWAQNTTTFEAYLFRERPNSYTVCRILSNSDRINPVFDSILEDVQLSRLVRVKLKKCNT